MNRQNENGKFGFSHPSESWDLDSVFRRNVIKNTEAGNAIFLIIMGVALFAALGYAFTSSNRTSTTLMTDEQATAQANQIIAYGNEVKQAVKRLLLRGCDDTEISFENNIVAGYTNPNAPDSKKCHVFDVAGGGLTWYLDDSFRATESSISSSGSSLGYYRENDYKHLFKFPLLNNVYDNGTPDGTSEAVDLIAVGMYVDRKVCEAINNRLGNNETIQANVEYNGLANVGGTKFRGFYTPHASPSNPNSNAKQICVYVIHGGLRHYFFVTVLIPR